MPTGPRSLHLVGSLDLASGGPTQSVTQLCEALNALGAPAEIATVAGPGEPHPSLQRTPVHAFPLQWPQRLRRSAGLAAFLDREGGRFDLVHVHGLWQWPGLLGRRAAQRLCLPLVISPRGMLEPWSLQQRAALKRLALRTWEGRNLRVCRLLHATCEAEAAQFRALGLGPDIAIVPNGVVLPPERDREPGSVRRTLLFLSRFHPKKGADLLLRAWAGLHGSHPSWDLVLAGPDPDGYRGDLEQLAADLDLPVGRVQFRGPVAGEGTWSLLASASLFVLPSHSENFGNVVLEALASGVPVITTHGTPWSGLEAHGCGWWVACEPEAIAAALQAALSLPDSVLCEMGQRGKDWSRQFTWPAIAGSMLQAYATVATG